MVRPLQNKEGQQIKCRNCFDTGIPLVSTNWNERFCSCASGDKFRHMDAETKTRFTLTDAARFGEEVKKALTVIECQACGKRMARIDLEDHMKESESCQRGRP